MSDDLRTVLEQLAQAMGDGLEKALGRPVEIGLHGHWDDEEVLKRKLPLRAAVCELGAPLADCAIAVTNMAEDAVKSGLAAALVEVAESLGCSADVSAPEVYEFDERDEALEQLDALFTEPTLHFTTPRGELVIVVGSGLAEAAGRLARGEAAPQAEAPTYEAATVSAEEAAPPDDAPLAAPLPTSTDDSELPYQADVSTRAAAADEYVELSGAAARGNEGAGAAGTAPAGLPAAGSADPAALAAAAEANAQAASPQMEELLSGVEVELSAELGRTHMRLGDITSLATDSVLTLDQLVDEPVRVFVNGTAFGSARLVMVGDEYGIEMLEVFGTAAEAEQQPLAA